MYDDERLQECGLGLASFSPPELTDRTLVKPISFRFDGVAEFIRADLFHPKCFTTVGVVTF